MTRIVTIAALTALTTLLPGTSHAGVDGYWKTIDDDTGRPKSVVHVQITDGVATGQLIQLYREWDEEPDDICDDCVGELHNEKIIGMVIINDLTQDGDEWSGGTILDPGNGKTYRCFIEEMDDGRLKVRGYIGFALIGRTQYWYRTEPDLTVKSILLNDAGETLDILWTDGREATEEAIKAHLGADHPKYQ